VSDIVQSNARETSVPFKLREPRAEKSRGDSRSIFMGEDEPGVVPRSTDPEPILELPNAMTLELGRRRGDRDPLN
jgi:hypothetical protein